MTGVRPFMRDIISRVLILLGLVSFQEEALSGGLGPERLHPQGSVDGKGAYVTGVYPNLFVDLLGKDSVEISAKVESAFRQLFHGDARTQRVYYPVDPDLAYIQDIANADVRTEGMSYGMMIAVQMDRKEEFDRLWKWAKTHMQFSAGPHRGYFGWHCRTDGSLLDSTAASDGEEWFVMSLFFASARWGDGQGIYSYRDEANRILHTMLHKESEPGHGYVTNMFNANEKLVAFVPEVHGNEFTDPSYQVPHYYELWARWAAEDNPFWCDAAAASRRLLKKAAHPETGLSPDYSRYDGTAFSPPGRGHDVFRFDAWRVSMNVALDWVWFGKDEWAVTQSNRVLDFFHGQSIRTYGNQYTLDGKKLGDDHSPGLVAMNAVAALASSSRQPEGLRAGALEYADPRRAVQILRRAALHVFAPAAQREFQDIRPRKAGSTRLP